MRLLFPIRIISSSSYKDSGPFIFPDSYDLLFSSGSYFSGGMELCLKNALRGRYTPLYQEIGLDSKILMYRGIKGLNARLLRTL